MLPVIIWLLLMVSSLTVSIIKHGQPRDPYNAGTTFFAIIIEMAILWWGGFFAPLFK